MLLTCALGAVVQKLIKQLSVIYLRPVPPCGGGGAGFGDDIFCGDVLLLVKLLKGNI